MGRKCSIRENLMIEVRYLLHSTLRSTISTLIRPEVILILIEMEKLLSTRVSQESSKTDVAPR
jgi:hypothetical protein